MAFLPVPKISREGGEGSIMKPFEVEVMTSPQSVVPLTVT